MNVTIEDSCIGCGACESICDAVFHVEDRAEVKEAGIAGNEACVEEAANACPVSAITVAQDLRIPNIKNSGLLKKVRRFLF